MVLGHNWGMGDPRTEGHVENAASLLQGGQDHVCDVNLFIVVRESVGIGEIGGGPKGTMYLNWAGVGIWNNIQ